MAHDEFFTLLVYFPMIADFAIPRPTLAGHIAEVLLEHDFLVGWFAGAHREEHSGGLPETVFLLRPRSPSSKASRALSGRGS